MSSNLLQQVVEDQRIDSNRIQGLVSIEHILMEGWGMKLAQWSENTLGQGTCNLCLGLEGNAS